MRAKEFINELNMSPGKLIGFAQSSVGQQIVAGFEAELVFTKLNGGSSPDDESVPDYDRDEDIGRNTDIIDIKGFFDLHKSEITKINQDYEDYVLEKWEEYEDESRVDTYHSVRNDEEELAAREDEGDTDAIDRLYDLTTDRMREDFDHDYRPTVKDWLRHEGIYTMSDLSREYDYIWPHMKAVGDWRESADTVADYISGITGKKSEVFSEYHGDTKYPNIWYVEPDGSIECEPYEFGAEVVSPPMPLTDLLAAMETVLGGLASNYGASSNKSTGLHIGVSMNGVPNANVDYVKLVLFLGDEYISSQFARVNSTYAKNAIFDLQSKAGNLDQREMAAIYSDMRDGMASSAATIISKRNHNRAMSVNMKDNYIELRSMGNDYMEKIPLVKNMVLRYAQAYAVAVDPEAYKQEYAKKLAKLIGSTGNDELAPFIRYVTRLNNIRQDREQIEKARQANPGADIPYTPFDDPRTAQAALKSSLKNLQGKTPGEPYMARQPAPKFPDPKPKPNQPLVQFPKPNAPQPAQPNQNTQNNG